MANFLLTYHGEGGMPTSAEEAATVAAAWTAWFGRLGEAVVDPGNPTSHTKAISPDGSVMDATSAPTGTPSSGLTISIGPSNSRRAALSSPQARSSSCRRHSRRCSSTRSLDGGSRGMGRANGRPDRRPPPARSWLGRRPAHDRQGRVPAPRPDRLRRHRRDQAPAKLARRGTLGTRRDSLLEPDGGVRPCRSR